MADMPASPRSRRRSIKRARSRRTSAIPWLGRALYIAATRHQQEFLDAVQAPTATRCRSAALSVPLRMGTLTPDWRMPTAAELRG